MCRKTFRSLLWAAMLTLGSLLAATGNPPLLAQVTEIEVLRLEAFIVNGMVLGAPPVPEPPTLTILLGCHCGLCTTGRQAAKKLPGNSIRRALPGVEMLFFTPGTGLVKQTGAAWNDRLRIVLR